MSDAIMEQELPEDNNQDNTPTEKTFTQSDLEKIVEQRLARERRKYEKQLEGIDVDEARRLMEEKQQAELERQKEKGEFEKVLKQVTEKKEQTIQQLSQKLHEIQVDGALLNAASTNNAVNPQQVVQLLKSQTRLNEDGAVEVLDSDGSVRYNDSGSPLSVNELVSDFLTVNPHFVKATAGGTGSKGATGGSTPKPESVADMLANWDTGGKEAYAALKNGKR